MSAVIGSMALTLAVALTVPVVSERIDADSVGSVDLKPFTCSDTPRSTVIQRICYARSQRTMIVGVRGGYRAYCALPPEIYGKFVIAPSLGQFYRRTVADSAAFQCPQPRQPRR